MIFHVCGLQNPLHKNAKSDPVAYERCLIPDAKANLGIEKAANRLGVDRKGLVVG